MPYKDPEKRRAYYRRYNREERAPLTEEKKMAGKLYVARTPTKHREYYRNSVRRLRNRVLEFCGGKCVQCGFSDSQALQLDHIHGGGTTHRKARGLYGIWRDALVNPTEFQLLCANCNWIKRYDKKEAPVSCE